MDPFDQNWQEYERSPTPPSVSHSPAHQEPPWPEDAATDLTNMLYGNEPSGPSTAQPPVHGEHTTSTWTEVDDRLLQELLGDPSLELPATLHDAHAPSSSATSEATEAGNAARGRKAPTNSVNSMLENVFGNPTQVGTNALGLSLVRQHGIDNPVRQHIQNLFGEHLKFASPEDMAFFHLDKKFRKLSPLSRGGWILPLDIFHQSRQMVVYAVSHVGAKFQPQLPKGNALHNRRFLTF